MKIFDPQLTGSIEVKNPISGSVTTLGNVIALGSDSSLTGSFTGSFKGDGSELVGVIVDSGSWDGIFTGSAAISGSLNISGAEAIQLTVEKRIRGQYYSVYNSTAATYAGYLITSGDFEDDATTDLGLASGTGRNIRFYTANNPVEKMRLTTDGNLGIGIAPSSTTSLHIYKSDPILLIQASNTSGDAELQFFPRDGSNVAHLQSIKGNGSNLVFSTGGNSGNSYVPTEALTISSGGAATFSSSVTVDVNSNTLTQEILKVKGGGSVGNYGFLVESNGGDDLFKVDTLTYNSYFGGNVGIGTAAPDLGGVSGTRVLTIASPTAERWGILELAGNRTYGGNQVGELKFISTDATNNGTLVSLTAVNDTSATGTGGSLKFNTRENGGSLTERMRISSGGDATFSGKISSVKELININSADGTRSLGLESDSSGNIWIGTGTTAATINLVTGNSTNGLPSINGVKRLCINREGTDVYASYAGNTSPFRVGYLNGSSVYTPTFVIKDDGDVGIGTDSPQVPLQIGTHLVAPPSDTGLCVSNRKSIRINDTDGNYDYGVYIKQNYSIKSLLTLGTRHAGTDTDGLVVKDGDVGIGTDNPTYGRVEIRTPSATGYTPVGFVNPANIRLSTGGTAGTNVTTGISMGVGGSAETYIGTVQNSSGHGDIVFQSYDNTTGGGYSEKMRISSSGVQIINSTTSTAIYSKQQTGTYVKTSTGNANYMPMVRVGHTMAVTFSVYARINDSNVGTGVGEMTAAYGISSGGVVRQSLIGAVTGVGVVYNNSNYELQAVCNYTGGTAPTLHLVVEGLSSENFVAQ